MVVYLDFCSPLNWQAVIHLFLMLKKNNQISCFFFQQSICFALQLYLMKLVPVQLCSVSQLRCVSWQSCLQASYFLLCLVYSWIFFRIQPWLFSSFRDIVQ